MSTIEAICWKWPGAEVSERGDILIWHTQEKAQDEIDTAIIEFQLFIMVKAIKAEAQNRIEALVGSDTKQRNALGLAATLLEKKFDGTLTAAEVTMMDSLRQAQAGVVAIRTRSNELEASLASMTAAQLDVFDPNADVNWS